MKSDDIVTYPLDEFMKLDEECSGTIKVLLRLVYIPYFVLIFVPWMFFIGFPVILFSFLSGKD